MARRNRQEHTRTEHTRDRKYWEQHAEAFILQWNDNGGYDDDDDDDDDKYIAMDI